MNKSNILRTTRLSRVFSLAVLLCCTLWAAAGEFAGVNRLRFADESASIMAGEEKTLAVILDNDDAVAAVEFIVNVPECLEIVSVKENKDRLPAGTRAMFNTNVNKFRIYATRSALIGNSGDPIAYITVKGKKGGNGNLGLSNIRMSDIHADKTLKLDGIQVTSAFTVAEVPLGNVKISAVAENTVMNPNGKMKVSVSLDNDMDVYGLQLNINVPEGFTVDDFTLTGRATDGTAIYPTLRPNGVTTNLIIINDMVLGEPTLNGNSGEVVSFTLTAPSEFSENVTVKIDEVIASLESNEAIFDKSGYSFNLTNGKVAHTRALETVAALQTKLDEALAKIAETCPDVKDQFTGTAVAEKITALGQAVEAAYADLTLTPNYDNVMAPATDIENEIAALVDEAAKAQASFEADKTEAERQAANKAAYNADIEAIAALQKSLDEMNAQVTADYAGFDVTEQQTGAQNAIDAAKQAADTALAAVEKEGNYTNTIDKDGVNAAIQTILEKAKELKANAEEAARQAANKAAYDADVEAIAALQNELDGVVATIAGEYAGCDVTDQQTAAQNMIDAASEAAKNAFAAVEKEGIYTNTIDSEGIKAAIQKVLDRAKELKAELDRQAANKAAYDADVEAIAALQKSLDEMNAKMAAEYVGCDVTEQQTAAQNAIDAARQAADAALAAVETAGNYTNTIDSNGINAAIQAILDKANELKAEADRQAANKAAYDADVEAIAALQKSLDEMNAKMAAEYVGCDVTEQQTAAQNAIDAARQAVDAAFAAVETAGNYTNTIDSNGINAAIQAILDKANELKAEADRQAANKAAYDADVEAIAALQKSLDEMNAKMAAEYVGCDVTEQQTAAQNAIDAARQDADAALAAVETVGNYTNTIDSKGINAAIQAILDKANVLKAELDRQAANKAAYDADVEAIAALQKSLDEMNARMAADYATCDVTEQQTAAQNAINAASAAADATFAAVEKEGKYSNTIDKEGINAAIQAILTRANELQTEENRQANNKKAYDADLETIAGLQKSLDEVNAKIETEYVGCDVSAQQTAAQNAIDTARKVADAVYAAVENAGNYSNKIDTEGINNAIKAILDRAAELKAELDREGANKAAHDADIAVIDALQKSLEEMNAQVGNDYAGMDVAEQQNAAQDAINAARQAADAALAAVENEGKYTNTVDKGGIEAAIQAILDRAKELQSEEDRKVNNRKAYEADMETLKALQESLDEMNTLIIVEYADCDVTVQQLIAQNSIETARKVADALYASVQEQGTYSNNIDKEGIEADIQAILDHAKEIRQAANKAAYEADLEAIAAFQTTLDEVNTQVAEEFAGFDVTEQQTAAQNAVNAAKEAADAAYAAVETEGVYTNTIDNDAIAAAIQAIVDRASELKAEADRKAANQAAYDADLQALDAHQARLEEVKGILATDYEGHDVSEHVANAQNSIDAAREAADAAFAAVEAEGEYASAIDHEGIAAGIEAILDRAAELKAEAERQAANKEAYDADLETIAGLRTQLEEAVKTCDEQYPNYGYAEEQEAIAAAIDAQQTQADEAYAAVETEGEYSNTVDTLGIETMIEDMLKKAADFTTGVTMINGERLPADARIFTLDGREYAVPQPGKVNIVVYGDGTVSKVFVK